jgi:hypothetical protein
MRAWMTRLALVYCASASVRAADLYPPAAPDEAGSAMVSGQAILNRLQTGTNAPLRSGAFTEPVAGPTAGTMPTLNEIMAAAPATNAAAAAPGEVLAGKAYWGLVESAWGTQTGTMTNQAALGFMPGPANVTIPAGYYSGSGVVTGDVDLVTANIRAGVNLFGVTGTPAVVNTASGTATAGNMLTGNTAYVNGSLVTGTMATRTLSAANATVSAGYYAATTLTNVDPDLAATNIRVSTVIFGQTGTLRPALGDATAAQVLSGRTFTTNNSAQLTGTMPSNALSAANATVSAGYYAATTLTNVDADLKATNVAQGVTIFGVTGSVYRTTVPKTGQTTSYQSGDDGAYEKGEAWPSSRFTVQANTNCVLDNLTGLTWARNANLYGGTRTWTEAHTYCEGLSYGGQTDWRLPNVREFLSLIDYGRPAPSLPSGHPFANVQLEAYWTSSTIADDTLYAWAMVLQGYSGRSTYGDKEYPLFLWPVRGGQ